MGEEPGQRLRRKSLVGPRDGEQHGVEREWIDAVEGTSHEASKASGLGTLDQGEQRAGRVVLTSNDQAIDSGASGVEEVVGSLGGHADVRHERQPRQALLDLSDAFEVRRLLPVEVNDGDTHGLAVAEADK